MFSLFSKKYQLLRGQDDKDGAVQRRICASHRFILRCFFVLLTISISINGVLLYSKLYPQVVPVYKSEFAQLTRETSRTFVEIGRQFSIPHQEWEIPAISPGVVALTDEFAVNKQLPLAQRYPWDTRKGIYFLQGHHNLHCLKMIRNSILEYRHHLLQTQHYKHIDHCLLVLRDDILCNADDTPRITSGDHEQRGSGIGQGRLCRDWSKLEAWAIEHTACYKEANSRDDDQLGLYMHCPDGSEPWEGLLGMSSSATLK